MQEFLSRKINAEDFCNRVFELRRNHITECKEFLFKLASGEIKNFVPNKKSPKLKGFLSSLYFECEDYIENINDYNDDEFYTCIQNGFLKYQEALREKC